MVFLPKQFSPILLKNRFPFLSQKILFHGLAQAEDDIPKYPPIIDASRKGLIRHERQLFYDRVKTMPTVEQKLHSILEHIGFFDRKYMIQSSPSSYLGVPFYHYITRTHFIHNLPENMESLNVDNDYQNLKPTLCDAITKNFTNTWRNERLSDMKSFLTENESGSKLASELLSHICRNLAWKNNHLLTSALDDHPEIHSYWFHSGYQFRTKYKEFNDVCLQFVDQPCFSMRINMGLPPIVAMDDPLCATGEVERYHYHPRQFGHRYEARNVTSIPGFWPGDERTFPLLQVYTKDKFEILLKKINYFDESQIIDAFGVMASFGWLNTLANYHGFTTYHDLTYPLVGQTILTNGQDWTFFVYQLNTISLHSDVDKKDRRNLCWTSKEMRLFDTIEDGEIKGLNDDVLKNLLKFALHQPKQVCTETLMPYLGEDNRTEEEIAVMRHELRRSFRNLPTPFDHLREVPLWQHIYKRHKDAPPCPWIRLQ